MKQVLVFAGYFYPHVGGFEKNISELSRRLIEKGYQVDIITDNSNNSPAEEQLGEIYIYRIPCWNILGGTYPIPRPSIKGSRILIKLLKKHYDIVNTQTRFFVISFYGLIFSKLKHIPLIHTERGSRHSVLSNKIVDIISQIYDHTLGSIIVRSAKINIGISEAAGTFLQHLGAHNIHIIPNGIDTDLYQKRDSEWRNKLRINQDTIVITFVGRLISGKGVQDLMTIIPNIKKKFPNIILLIVGDGPYKNDLEKQSSASNYSNNILFLGSKEQKDIIDILSITDIFVNPSYSEGLPTSVMEAASIGLPIIATDVGGTKEIIIDKETGFLIGMKDNNLLEKRLCTLLIDEKLRKTFAHNSRKYISTKYNWDDITEQMVGILNKLD